MSFLLVAGKLFYCEMCKKSIKVEYEGGPRMTQIGDLNVYHQLSLSKLRGQPNKCPNEEGYYLYDDGTCLECYRTRIFEKNREKEERINKFVRSVTALEAEKSAAIGSIEKLIETSVNRTISDFEIKNVSEVTGEDFDPYFGDKHITPVKRKKAYNFYFQNKISRGIHDYFVGSSVRDAAISEVIDKFNKAAAIKYNMIRKIVGSDRFTAYLPAPIKRPENLNNFIMASNTVRVPASNTPDFDFYHPIDISVPEVEKRLSIQKKDIASLIINAGVGLEKLMKEKIAALLNILP